MCFKLWTYVLPYQDDPVLERVFRVIHYVYSQDIIPETDQTRRNGGVRWCFIKPAWSDFVRGIRLLHSLCLLIRRKDIISIDDADQVLFLCIAQFKQQVLNPLEDRFRSVKLILEADGFVREMVQSDIFHLWKSLFDQDGKVIKNRIINHLFKPLLGKPRIPETDFAEVELKKEAVRFGVELSIYVAQAMFLLSDEVHSVLWFCLQLWRDKVENNMNPFSPVVERLLRVIHYVYLTGIEPKNGLYRTNRVSVQTRLVVSLDFEFGFTFLDLLVLYLRREGGSCFDGRVFMSNIEQELKRLEEKLSPAKAVLEANGFTREAMESTIFGLWDSLFDKEAEEATQTLELVKREILTYVFLHLMYNPV